MSFSPFRIRPLLIAAVILGGAAACSVYTLSNVLATTIGLVLIILWKRPRRSE